MGTLRYQSIDEITFADLEQNLTQWFVDPLPASTWALAQSPRAYQFGAIQGGRLLAAGGGPLAQEVYSIRLFTPAWEARWARLPENPAGRLVIVSETAESDNSISPAVIGTASAVNYLGSIDGEYLIWGEHLQTDHQQQAIVLSSQRIGSIALPQSVSNANNQGTRSARYRLQVREYLRDVADGNVAVVEERLLGIASAP